MNKDSIIQTLRGSEIEIRHLGVDGLFLFGSIAKDNAHANSDIDLFFDKEKKEGFTLFHLASLHEKLEDLTGRKVDLMSREGIHPRRREAIQEHAIQIF